MSCSLYKSLAYSHCPSDDRALFHGLAKEGGGYLTGRVAMVRSIPPTAFWSSSTLAEVADLRICVHIIIKDDEGILRIHPIQFRKLSFTLFGFNTSLLQSSQNKGTFSKPFVFYRYFFTLVLYFSSLNLVVTYLYYVERGGKGAWSQKKAAPNGDSNGNTAGIPIEKGHADKIYRI